jgi:hypothetical protein
MDIPTITKRRIEQTPTVHLCVLASCLIKTSSWSAGCAEGVEATVPIGFLPTSDISTVLSEAESYRNENEREKNREAKNI